jgi:hypothetical protein
VAVAALWCCLQEWIERYKDNRAAAAAELMTLLVQVRFVHRLWCLQQLRLSLIQSPHIVAQQQRQ